MLYIFLELSLGNKNQYNKRKFPIPVKLINNHQPDLLMSCNLLTLTATPGIHVKKKTNKDMEPLLVFSNKIMSNR